MNGRALIPRTLNPFLRNEKREGAYKTPPLRAVVTSSMQIHTSTRRPWLPRPSAGIDAGGIVVLLGVSGTGRQCLRRWSRQEDMEQTVVPLTHQSQLFKTEEPGFISPHLVTGEWSCGLGRWVLRR